MVAGEASVDFTTIGSCQSVLSIPSSMLSRSVVEISREPLLRAGPRYGPAHFQEGSMRVLITDRSRLMSLLRWRAPDARSPRTRGCPANGSGAGRVDPQVLVVRSTRVLAEHLAVADPCRSSSVREQEPTPSMSRPPRGGGLCRQLPGQGDCSGRLTFGHLLNLDRRISDNVQDLREGRWAKKAYGKARGVHGRTLALLGCGRIGQEVIQRAHAFGMSVRAWSRSLTPERAEALGVTHAASPLDARRGADVLSVHLALTDETRGLVDGSLLEALAPGAFVINTSRGGVVARMRWNSPSRPAGSKPGWMYLPRSQGPARTPSPSPSVAIRPCTGPTTSERAPSRRRRPWGMRWFVS